MGSCGGRVTEPAEGRYRKTDWETPRMERARVQLKRKHPHGTQVSGHRSSENRNTAHAEGNQREPWAEVEPEAHQTLTLTTELS